jgi:predicted adenine nucleotide alpha hydrolase (AANH) superfamily ATPase
LLLLLRHCCAVDACTIISIYSITIIIFFVHVNVGGTTS